MAIEPGDLVIVGWNVQDKDSYIGVALTASLGNPGVTVKRLTQLSVGVEVMWEPLKRILLAYGPKKSAN